MIVESFGGPGEVRGRELPDPVPGPGQVLLRTEAVGVGYVDVMASRGLYPYFPEPGAAPGLEAAGVVAAVGDGVPDGLVGRRVLGLPAFGGFAELVAVDADRVFLLDDSLTPVDAVALGVNALVAQIGLARAGVTEGERVLVRGAGGGIGVLATRIAHARGAHVTVVTSSADRAERLRGLGADRAVRRDEATALDPEFDVVVDTVGGPELGPHLRLLAPNGRYLLCGAAGGVPTGDDLATVMELFHRSPALLAFSLNSVGSAELRSGWAEVAALASSGRVRGVVETALPLDRAREALEMVDTGGVFGKVVLTA